MSHTRQYISNACSTGLNRRGTSLTQAGVTTLELQISDQTTHPPSHLVFSIFPELPRPVSNYDILSTIQVLNIPLMNQGRKALNLASGVCHSTSTGILSTKHSLTNGFFHYDRIKVIYKEYNAF
jgi:hypothetical protein